MWFAKQSTAFTVSIGPVLAADGSEYTGLVVSDLKIRKHDGSEEGLNASATLTATSNGRFTLVGTTSDVDTLGRCQIFCDKSTYQMPPLNFTVLPATSYNAMIANGTIASTTSGRTIVVDAAGLADANTVKVGPSGSGATQTARDIGESVLLSSGTGTGQVLLSSGIVQSDLQTIKTQSVTCSATVTVSPYVGSTGAAVNGTNVNTLSSHDPGGVLATQAQITGGPYSLSSDFFSFNAAMDFTTAQKAATLARVTLVDQLSNNNDKTGYSLLTTPPTASAIADAVRDVSNATPTAGSLGYDTKAAATYAYAASGQTTGASIRSAIGLGAANMDTQLLSIYGVAGDTKSQTDKLQFDGSNYVKSSPQSDSPGIAGIPAAVRDIDNTDPAANSLGSDVKSIKINGVPVTSTNSLVQTQIGSAVWAKDTSTITTAGSIGKRLLDLFSGITSLAQWLGLIVGKQTGDSTALAEIRATGVGSGGFTPTTDSLEAHRDVLGTPVDTDLSTDIANIAADVLALDVGAGSGVHHVTITFTSGGDPFEGATVTTLLGGVLKANALSGSDGVADNYLNDGTYTLNYAAEGHLGGTTTFAVSADGQNKNISLTLLAITPSDPGFTTGYLVAYTDGAEAENVKHTRTLVKLPEDSTGLSIDAAKKTAYSNSSGIVQFTNHIPGATYEVRRADARTGDFQYIAGDTDGFEIKSCAG